MCNPAVFAVTAILATAASTAVSMSGQAAQAQAASQAASMQSQMNMYQVMMANQRAVMNTKQAEWAREDAEDNKKMSEKIAASIQEKGQYDADRIALQAMRARGTGRVAYAQGNVLLDYGSPLDWEVDLAEAAAADEALTKGNSDLQAWGQRMSGLNDYSKAMQTSFAYKTQALNEESNAAMALFGAKSYSNQADSAITAGGYNQMGSLLSGVGSMATSAWKMFGSDTGKAKTA